ncbi:hypothetical protein SBI_01522 [Streptomyces bingchenggensis BCW-1]|uniref:SnoaL-like domain-containing protein n=1 Tax=Streptomyces bingchenggensis (strain BCW-1) TaxID=749414 RepID=D7CDX8_STRBB|nr:MULTISPECIES: nuclear transport factor 2 family protein [Streptomyces]ADI04643.1 hypothetical protein SBI_01522 [Streptomyces bingchenggensis BCW-1]
MIDNQPATAAVRFADEIPTWVTELYTCFDAMDVDAAVARFSADARVRFGSGKETIGHAEYRAAAAPFLEMISRVSHRFRQVWECGDSAVLVADVDYTLRDGRTMCLPAVTLLRRRADGIIKDMQVYLDIMPMVTA